MTAGRKTIRVEVTAQDIADGVPNSVEFCPVARALTRTMRHPYGAKVARRDGHWVGIGVMLGRGTLWAEWRLSRAVGTFIDRFDHDERVRPFTFRVVR